MQLRLADPAERLAGAIGERYESLPAPNTCGPIESAKGVRTSQGSPLAPLKLARICLSLFTFLGAIQGCHVVLLNILHKHLILLIFLLSFKGANGDPRGW
jgi:hypothetical protein